MIKVEKVSKSYGEFYALKDISFEIEQGEFVILLGVSGSGKSTLLSLIGAFDKPTSGFIEVDGDIISKFPDFHASTYRRKKIGFVFQDFNLIASFSVKENILSATIPLNQSKKETNKRIDDAMSLANISHKASQNSSSLSGGEKQRCAIARALVNHPDILLFDEPTASLDSKSVESFIEMLETFHQMGKSIILATHDARLLDLKIKTKVIKLQDGEIIV
jgi:putative ABC transport system ATP-binding protein